MIKIVDRTPLSRVELLQLDSACTSPIKRSIKISNQKFPSDFFKDVKQSRDRNSIFQSMSKINGQIPRSDSRNVPRTQQQIRNMGSNSHLGKRIQNLDLNSDIKRRDMATALEYRGQGQRQYQQDLIRSVLTTAREMKKMIRKHSIELKKDRERQGQRDDAVVELPPLKLKRGFTTAF